MIFQRLSSVIWTWVSLVLLAFSPADRATYPTDYFSPPVRGTLLLSGTFGELRPNHFHSGIDIKGTVGTPLYAAADGFVSRIKVEAGGYGNVIYLSHPNGYTTVYAHMNAFAPGIAAYVRSYQYSRETFEVDLAPEAGQFSFRKGDLIGEMGMTGHAFGPHLHFEIRDSRTERPVNPLLFGLRVADDQRPRMHQLKTYLFDENQRVAAEKIFSLVRTPKGYGIKGDTLRLDTRTAGFALKVYDHMNGVTNWNGIYRLDVLVDDSLVYNFEMETFAFSESRFLNAHLDFAEQVLNKAFFNRCFSLPGNALSIYKKQINGGLVPLDARPRRISMIASDLAGNETRLEFWARSTGVEIPEKPLVYNYFLPYAEESIIDNGSLYLHFPAGAFYEDVYLDYRFAVDRSSNVFSSVHHVHDPSTPVHRYFEIAVRPTVLPDALRDKAFMAYCRGNTVINYGGTWGEDGRLHARVRDFGDYCIMTDDMPPTIVPLDFKPDMRGAATMAFRISDNFPTGGTARGLQYRATVDGRWILTAFDAKKGRLVHTFDEMLTPGQHQLRLTVTDHCGNESVFEGTFQR